MSSPPRRSILPSRYSINRNQPLTDQSLGNDSPSSSSSSWDVNNNDTNNNTTESRVNNADSSEVSPQEVTHKEVAPKEVTPNVTPSSTAAAISDLGHVDAIAPSEETAADPTSASTPSDDPSSSAAARSADSGARTRKDDDGDEEVGGDADDDADADTGAADADDLTSGLSTSPQTRRNGVGMTTTMTAVAAAMATADTATTATTTEMTATLPDHHGRVTTKSIGVGTLTTVNDGGGDDDDGEDTEEQKDGDLLSPPKLGELRSRLKDELRRQRSGRGNAGASDAGGGGAGATGKRTEATEGKKQSEPPIESSLVAVAAERTVPLNDVKDQPPDMSSINNENNTSDSNNADADADGSSPTFTSKDQSPNPLRVTCYGSSSATTPAPYLNAAKILGQTLALRGHTCVNGAGSSGCMAAMNDGVLEEGGHVVGVIHEMFVVDRGVDAEVDAKVDDDEGTSSTSSLQQQQNGSTKNGSTKRGVNWLEAEGGAHSAFHGGEREILVAGGNDLQERKRLLVEGADALVVLPGGMGTWDELWEMACSRSLGFTSLPIVCVNVNGYYDPFVTMLERAHNDGLIRDEPDGIVHFEPDSVKAVRWIEEEVVRQHKKREEEEEEEAVGAKKEEDYRRMDSALTVDRYPLPKDYADAEKGEEKKGAQPPQQAPVSRRDSRLRGSIFTASWGRRASASASSRSRKWVRGKLVEVAGHGGAEDWWSERTAVAATGLVMTFAVGVAVGAAVAARGSSSSR